MANVMYAYKSERKKKATRLSERNNKRIISPFFFFSLKGRTERERGHQEPMRIIVYRLVLLPLYER